MSETKPSKPIHRRRLLASFPLLPSALQSLVGYSEARTVRFGIITDVHQDVMHDGPERLRQFVQAMQRAEVDFIIQLGDFCVPHPRNLGFMEIWKSFQGARYHVLGNHDMDGGYQRQQTVEYYQMPGRYYTFDAGPIRGIVLDTNDPGGTAKGYKKYIAKDQLRWLEDQLEQSDRPICLFLHHPLDEPKGIENRSEVRALLEKAQAKSSSILGVFSGHFHEDYHRVVQQVRYLQINSASYVWLGEAGAKETFDVQVHKKHPSLRSVAAYREPLWALVTLDFSNNRLILEGRESQWVGPDPWERGVKVSDYPKETNRPRISGVQAAIRDV